MRGGAMIDETVYAVAVLRHTDRVLQMFTGERLINKIFGKVLQSHAMGRLVIAHFDWKAGAGPQPTLASLQEQTQGGRTLAAFVGIAKVARLINAVPNADDRRQKYLVPSDRIVAGLRDWLHHHLELAETVGLMPPGCAQRLKEDEAYFEAFVRASTLVIDGVQQAATRFMQWHWFEGRECGQRIAYALLQAHYRACLDHALPVHESRELDITGGAIARLLGLSKSHVRNVLNGAEQYGILIHDESRRRMWLTEAFLLEARDQFIDLLTLMARVHGRAEAALRRAFVGAPLHPVHETAPRH